ncbi:MAG: hypothetical protein RMJ97_02325 [Raineya sp.]|nr:hypothetical protein [Raineya sp.]
MKTCVGFFIFFLLVQVTWGQVKKTDENKPNKSIPVTKDQKTASNKVLPQKNNQSKIEQKALKDTSSKNKIVKPYKPPKNPQDSILTLEQLLEQSIIIDSTCPRCKGYKYDRACDGLYCYSGQCSSCKGYRKCIHCDGTMYKGAIACPFCKDIKEGKTEKGTCPYCKDTQFGARRCIYCFDGTMKLKEKADYLKFKHLEGCPECTDGKCRVCRGTGICEKCQGSGVMLCLRCKGTGLKPAEQIKAEKIKKVEEEKRRMREREAKELMGGN